MEEGAKIEGCTHGEEGEVALHDHEYGRLSI